ncbi:hypothetical protein B0H10DRAFT_626859 [Mycena sp. CBHHK59/15]|nr:hypothetical protein B0H10DRAFT_626859 [Mycena sp. CBHHK59/15]
MGVFGIFSSPVSKNAEKNVTADSTTSPDLESVSAAMDPTTAAPPKVGAEPSPIPLAPDVPAVDHIDECTKPPAPRRLSLRTFVPSAKHKPILSEVQEHEKKSSAATAFTKRFAKPLSSNSEKRAKESALIVRTLIVGPPSHDYAAPKLTKAVAKPQLSKVKSQLMQPNSANMVIAQLRALPAMDEAAEEGQDAGKDPGPTAPIHAVCLAYPDAEEHEIHFSKLTPDAQGDAPVQTVPGVTSASLERLTNMLSEMHVVDLVKAPDLGLGQPGDGDGLLAGAVPTAETIINGVGQITPQLMALGYATGRAILPDHKGIHPPTDRMSVITYWWGLEVVLPPPTLEYLSNAQSISGTAVNFLTALSLINNGVREILPFVRYIAQFMDFEFNAIKRQDHGQGVVCAATWIMPAALVPRPWDFPPPETSQLSKDDKSDKSERMNPVSPPPLTPELQCPSTHPQRPR